MKPFEVAELVARVESVLRRTGRGGALLRAWDVTVDTVARSATKAGVPVALTPREFDLLEQLLRNRGAALYRDVLFERVDVYKRQVWTRRPLTRRTSAPTAALRTRRSISTRAKSKRGGEEQWLRCV